jgi:hypothetical protein
VLGGVRLTRRTGLFETITGGPMTTWTFDDDEDAQPESAGATTRTTGPKNVDRIESGSYHEKYAIASIIS